MKTTAVRLYGKRDLRLETFDLPELKILIDAVLSAKFITEKKSKELVGKLSIFAGKNKAEELRRNISVENRVKKDNEQIYLIIDAIDKAITNGNKISFRYFKYLAPVVSNWCPTSVP